MLQGPRSPLSQSSGALITRGMTYEVLGNLLICPPMGPSESLKNLLYTAAGMLEEVQPRLGVRLAILAEQMPRTRRSEWKRLLLSVQRLVQPECTAPPWTPRAETCQMLGIVSRPDRLGDLQILASLARASAMALLDGEDARAATLLDVEARFVRDHACECLDMLADELRLSGQPFLEQLGWALAALLEQHTAGESLGN